MTIEEALAWVDLCAGIPSPVIDKMSDEEILVKCLGTQDALAAEVRLLQAALARAAQDRDAAIAAQIAAQVEAGKWRTDFDAARAEAARLKEPCRQTDAIELTYCDRAMGHLGPHSWELDELRAEAARLREAIQAALDSPNHMSSEDIDILLAALDTPAREGGEGR